MCVSGSSKCVCEGHIFQAKKKLGMKVYVWRVVEKQCWQE